jgi:hypothetical protein
MAPLPANDVEFWVPPTPANVLLESGYVAPAANVGAWAPNNTTGWTCQTYLSYAGAGIVQTYTLEAPAEEKPKRVRAKKVDE